MKQFQFIYHTCVCLCVHVCCHLISETSSSRYPDELSKDRTGYEKPESQRFYSKMYDCEYMALPFSIADDCKIVALTIKD